MKSARKRIAGLIVGWSFIILGVAGLVLPFLQGVLFILIGLIILSSQYAWARLALAKLRKRFPKTYQAAENAARKIEAFWKQVFRARSVEDENKKGPRAA